MLGIKGTEFAQYFVELIGGVLIDQPLSVDLMLWLKIGDGSRVKGPYCWARCSSRNAVIKESWPCALLRRIPVSNSSNRPSCRLVVSRFGLSGFMGATIGFMFLPFPASVRGGLC